jgi:antitoxin (DNA-binding transcriptional repressor) of toxin-antitoxin stability system
MVIDKKETMGYAIRQRGGCMKFVSIKDLRASPADIWKQLPSEREMVVTNNGRPIALITPINDEMFEDTVTAVRRIKALNAMKKMQEISDSLGNNKMTLEKINAVIKEVRGKNKK